MVGKLGPLVGALDQGTSSTRFMVFAANTSQMVTYHQMEVELQSPHRGWVQQDPEELLNTSVTCIDMTVEKLKKLSIDPGDIVTIGVTNQRETVVVWDRISGKCLYPAIVWSDTRTKDMVASLKKCPGSPMVQARSGLPVATYFSAVKLRWLLDTQENVQVAYQEGRLMAGTVDSWLIWNLTGSTLTGLHLTDVTNASRTGLFNIHTLTWDTKLSSFYQVPLSILPTVLSSGDMFGKLEISSLAGVSITGCMGDQQAALLGHHCTRQGMSKVTMGTGCFLLVNVGVRPVLSTTGLVSTVAFKLGRGPTNFALEGSVGCAGAALDWLEVGLNMPREVVREEVVEEDSDSGGVVVVPAYGGLMCPKWAPDSAGLMLGLSLHTRPRHVVRATMEGVGHMLREVWECLTIDFNNCGLNMPEQLLLSGGLASNNTLCQVLATMMNVKLVRPTMLETTALGVAMVAGHTTGVWTLSGLSDPVDTFLPATVPNSSRGKQIAQWDQALHSSLGVEELGSYQAVEWSVERSLPGTIWMFSTACLVILTMAAAGHR